MMSSCYGYGGAGSAYGPLSAPGGMDGMKMT